MEENVAEKKRRVVAVIEKIEKDEMRRKIALAVKCRKKVLTAIMSVTDKLEVNEEPVELHFDLTNVGRDGSCSPEEIKAMKKELSEGIFGHLRNGCSGGSHLACRPRAEGDRHAVGEDVLA